MSSRDSFIRALAPAALAAAAGAAVHPLVDLQGARPAALAGALAAAALGAGAGTLLPGERLLRGRWGLGPLIAAASAAACVAGAGLPPPGPALLAGLAGASWALACGGAGSPAGALLAAAALIAGARWPAAGLSGALLAAAARSRRGVDSSPGRRGGLLPALEAAAVIAGAALLIVGAWSAGRASLDPTPGGLIVAGAASLIAAGLAAPLAPKAASALWPALGTAALLTPALLGQLPSLAARQLFPLAGAADPRALIAAMGAALVLPGALVLGLAWPRAAGRGPAPALAALAAGTWAGVDSGPALWSWSLWLALAAGAIALLRPGRIPRRLLGLGLAGAAVAARTAPLPWPEVGLLSGLTYQLRDSRAPDRASKLAASLTPLSGGWGPGGAALIQRDEHSRLLLWLDGLPVNLEGRAADSERFAGHLAALLAGGGERALAIGDDLGLASGALLAQGFEQIELAVPDVEALRALVALSPELEDEQLRPAVRHIRGSGEGPLRWGPPLDALVEVARTPWPDAHQGLPGPSRLARRARALKPDGVYVLVVPSIWLETEQLRGLLADFTEAFPAAWAFLPPSGADQLLLAGWTAPRTLPWAALTEVLQRGRDGLAALDIRSELDLADRALVGREGLVALAGAARARSLWLGATLHRLPRMNLPLLLPEVDSPAELFEVGGADAERLAQRAENNRSFLELLSAASAGKLDAVFEKGRALSERPGGSRAVGSVIDSSLERARDAIARARREGPSSPEWTRAIQELQAALLIAPRSAAALTLMAQCHLEQHNLSRAMEYFERALGEDPAELEALLGMGRVAVERGDLQAAETWFHRAAERHPESWLAAYQLGALLHQTRRLEEAELQFKKASKLGPDQYLPHLALGQLYIELGRGTQVVIQGDMAVAIEENADTLLLLGRGYMMVDQLDAAERYLTEAILKRGTLWQARALLCPLYIEKGDFQSAATFARDALVYAPGDPDIQQCLAEAEEAQLRTSP